ncbi:MAG: phosphoribosylformylglycinamidine synthase subunit PurL [Terriglobales bacterium]
MSFTVEQLRRQGLTPQEYARIRALLGREPNACELAIFGVMWSEHCSYKSSRLLLKQLPTTGATVLQGPGENAGAIDAGDGWACVFKIESHNHPSYVEPFQGAATGVGGILRDIFTMGARPVAILDSLRFGPLVAQGEDPDTREGLHWAGAEQPGAAGDVSRRGAVAIAARNRAILHGVVAGIAHYGNCFGVANLGGETLFDAGYSGNPLVNAMAVGLARREQLFYGRASGEGNPVIYVGAKTGRDGIHGATMASEEFSAASEAKRPNVQVGDPFLEKLLLEACLEAMATGAVVGIQDMGAAGLTSSSCEMGARSGTGIDLDLDRVPQRETAMTAEEMMLSESQERMLLVAAAGREAEVFAVFRKWGLDAAVVGRVTATGRLRVHHRGRPVADIPNAALTDEAPRYQRPAQAAAAPPEPAPAAGTAPPLEDALLWLVASPNLASPALIYEQYDSTIGANTLTAPGAGAGVLRLPGGRRALAMALDGWGRYCRLDPRQGARLAVAAAARQVACTGARPAAATNCLNLGNPEKPVVMWQLQEVIAGIAEACRALETPITGGNVSLYNETLGQGIDPTPVIGVVGLLELAGRPQGWRPPAGYFRAADRSIWLLSAAAPLTHGQARQRLGSSEYAAAVLGRAWGQPPALDLAREKALHDLLVSAVASDFLDAARPVSRGGIAVCLAKASLSRPVTAPDFAPVGARLAWPPALAPELNRDAELALFAEVPGWVVVSGGPEAGAELRRQADASGIEFYELGQTGGEALEIAGPGWRLELPVAALDRAWRGGLARALGETNEEQPAELAETRV